jgi:hypothetical protein
VDDKTKKKLQKAGVISLIIGFVLLVVSLLFGEKDKR